MNRLYTFIIFFLMMTTYGFPENRLEFGIGLEWEGSFTKDVEYQPVPGSEAVYIPYEHSTACFADSDYRPSISFSLRALDIVWIGLRASQGVNMTRSNFASVLSFHIPLPRANALLKFDLLDWFAIGIEFPYNPGIAFQFLDNHYIFVGSDDYQKDVTRNASHMSIAYLYIWKLE